MPTLDLREVPPPRRHGLVHEQLNALGPGEVLELVNDHKPTPLRYEIEATRPGLFAWEDGEAGPERFSAHITCLARIVDVRPIKARGEEPFDTIMAAVAALGEGEPLVILAPFDPEPLKGVLGEKGFTSETSQLDDGAFQVVFRRS